MENFNWEEFRKDRIAVHCDTQEKANDFLKQAHENGAEWSSTHSLLLYDNYHEFEGKTCYHLETGFSIAGTLYYGSLQYYRVNKYEIIEWELDAPKKFFYVASQRAEENCGGVVELTDAEHKAVRNFLDQMDIFCDGYCGSCGIEDRKFDTKKEAEDTLSRFL